MVSLCRVTRDTDNLVNQSKLDANACRQKNVCERISSGLDFPSDWMAEVAQVKTAQSQLVYSFLIHSIDSEIFSHKYFVLLFY